MLAYLDNKLAKPIRDLASGHGPAQDLPKPPPGFRRDMLRRVVDMGVPSMVSFLLMTIYDVVDIFWLAKLGTAPVAAVTVFGALLWVLAFGNNIIGSGSVAMISRSYGEGSDEKTAEAIRATFFLKFGVGAVSGLIGILILPWALSLYGTDPEVHKLALEFGVLQCAILGFPMVSFSVYTAFRGVGKPKLGMWISIIGALVNLVLDPLLIFGIGPFPRLEVLGASIATALGYMTVALSGAWLLSRPTSPVRVKWNLRPLPYEMMKRIFTIGFPSGFGSLSYSLMNSAVVGLFAKYGTVVVALFGMSQRVVRFGMTLNVGMGLGVGALVGQFLGAKDHYRAWHVSREAVKLSLIVMTVFGSVVWIFAGTIVGFFFSDPQMITEGLWFLRILVLSIPFKGVFEVIGNSYNGAGRNLPPMLFGVTTDWLLIVLSMAALGIWLDHGAGGMLIGYALGHLIGCILFYLSYRRGHWLHHEM
ncbi:MATE family efflux transporter [bacterium]|nr:MATE family efflux transporter [bacterium]